ncbi:hypothetical protein D3C78_1596240 [compost metagenome]
MFVQAFAEGVDCLAIFLAEVTQLEAEVGDVLLLAPANLVDYIGQQRVVVANFDRNFVKKAGGVHRLGCRACLNFALTEPLDDGGMLGAVG